MRPGDDLDVVLDREFGGDVFLGEGAREGAMVVGYLVRGGVRCLVQRLVQ
jgi:hypothetical protein